MKTPNFWKYSGIKSEVLIPFSLLYFCILRIRFSLKKWRQGCYEPSIPSICVGNATAGGAGKTPTAIALAHLLQAQNKKVAFVSKGYKGKHKEIIEVNPVIHDANLVGDEPRILAQHAPCFVCRKRSEGAKAAEKSGANVIIFDDGLHDPTVKKSFTIMVVDGNYGFGNGLVLPAGPLRDRLDIAISRSDIALILGTDTKDLEHTLSPHLPLHYGEIQPTHTPDTSVPYIAFAGIGLPEKFFNHLKSLQLQLADEIPFADHQNYSKRRMNHLLDLAISLNSQLITTEKDFARIDPMFHSDILVHKISLHFKDEDKFLLELKNHGII